jgi:hypothetical protein
VVEGDAALFAAITHEIRDNYWFIFYSERMDTMWILSSDEFIEEVDQNNNGKNRGKRSICLMVKRKIMKQERLWSTANPNLRNISRRTFRN